MRYAAISDIHSNLPALRAWIEAAPAIDGVWCLGDVVGYAAQPNECLDLLAKLNMAAWVPGNHDLGAIRRIPRDTFNIVGQVALEWTEPRLTPGNRARLEALSGPVQPTNDVTLVHASPRDPVWEYLFNCALAEANAGFMQTRVYFFGHTHAPTIFKLTESGCESFPIELDQKIALADTDAHWLVNPGSIGQPRDRDPRLSYLVFDDTDTTVEFHRLPYPIAETQARILAAGLPEDLAERLEYGI